MPGAAGRGLLAAVAAVGLLAGCDGGGSSTPRHVAARSSSTVVSLAPTTPPSGCPRVTYPLARLAFDCITTGMTQRLDGSVWPLAETKVVEPRSGWVLEEGAGHWGQLGADTLATITQKIAQEMVDGGAYGQRPAVVVGTDADTTVAGVAAHLLQQTVTLDPGWAATARTQVRQERLWVIALRVGGDDVSLWYVSLPDLVSRLWSRVPATIASISVTG